jgi:hypothetical protein
VAPICSETAACRVRHSVRVSGLAREAGTQHHGETDSDVRCARAQHAERMQTARHFSGDDIGNGNLNITGAATLGRFVLKLRFACSKPLIRPARSRGNVPHPRNTLPVWEAAILKQGQTATRY